MDWSKYPNFQESEFRCTHTGRSFMKESTLEKLQRVRTRYGKPLKVTSGCRDASHPIEARKINPGVHTTGHAVDLAVRGEDAVLVLHLALEEGFTGIGVQQKGDSRFLHLDDVPEGFPRPMIWSY
jgi:zinc D-Ala-D-Ala carboxypeptidase